MRKAAFWLLAGATIAIYLVMVLWSLPYISAQAGGAVPFDMRPTGYTFDEARAFLAALSPEGNSFYRDVQHRLDLFFPGMLAATLYCAIAALLPARLKSWRYVLPLPTLLVAAFDWSENAAVARLLAAGADAITPEMVAEASRWSMLKAGASTVVYTVLLILLIWKAVIRFRRRAGA